MTDHRRRQIEALFDRHARGVAAYVLARVGDANLAESITARVFVIVAERFDQCRHSQVGWLWSIVRSELARYFRDRRITRPLPTNPDDPLLAVSRDQQPDELASQRELASRLADAMEHLPPNQQQILFMKFFQDMRNVDIARHMEMSATHVGVTIHRSLKQLRRRLEPDNGDTA